jgi:transposase
MPQRRALAEIPVNRAPNHELSPGSRRQIYGRALAGQPQAEIAAAEKLHKSTVSYVINKASERQFCKAAPRIGRPKLWSNQDERQIVRYARLYPKFTYQELQRETRLPYSRATLRTILTKHGILNWRAKKRPYLSENHAKQRLEFALYWAGIDWSNYVFSDECSVEKGKGKKVVWSFGYPAEKWNHNKIETYSKGKGVTVMIWAAIGSTIERSELIFMERDPNSLKSGYSSVSYTDTLEEGLVPIYNGETFVQDNAPVHTSRHTINWLAEKGIYVLPSWPPYSPDLNPIEHLWPRLKEMLYELLPYLDDVQGSEEQRQLIIDTLPRAWQRIKQEVIHGCLDSINDRLQAVIDAEGWQTRY